MNNTINISIEEFNKLKQDAEKYKAVIEHIHNHESNVTEDDERAHGERYACERILDHFDELY